MLNAALAEHFFLRETSRLLVLALAYLAGAGLCHRLLRVHTSLSRSGYFAAIAGVTALFAVLPALSLLLPWASGAGTVWLISAGQIAVVAIIGALVFAASHARARDAGGTWRLAWLGIIPVANLALLILPPTAPLRAPTPRPRRAGLIALGLALLVAGRLADVTLQRAAASLYFPRPLEDVAAHLPPAPENPPLHLVERLARLAGTAELPRVIEEDLNLVEMRAEAGTLTLRFVLDVPDFPPFPPQVRDRIARELCRDPQFIADIQDGARIVYRYENAQGLRLGTMAATRETC